MQGVAVNGEDGRHSSFQALRLLPVSLFQLFSHIAHPPPPHHLHAAVEFSFPFYIFPFTPKLWPYGTPVNLLCCVQCCPLLGASQDCTHTEAMANSQNRKAESFKFL